MSITKKISWMAVSAALITLYSSAGFADPKEVADKATYLSEIVRELEKKWPDNRTINIVCHGHSVPAGYFKTPIVDTFNAYPHLLHQAVKERFPHAVVNVIVTAIGGEASNTGIARFERDVLTHLPDLLTIDYALNDRGIGLEKSRDNIATMIKKAKAKGIKVILLTPTWDTRANTEDSENSLPQHAAQIRELAREYEIGLADSYAAFQKHLRINGKVDDLMSQSNHPNRKGHTLVAQELLSWFSE